MTAGRRGRLVATVRRLGWGVADQGISSLSNFALGIVAASRWTPTEFGAFTLAFVTYRLRAQRRREDRRRTL